MPYPYDDDDELKRLLRELQGNSRYDPLKDLLRDAPAARRTSSAATDNKPAPLDEETRSGIARDLLRGSMGALQYAGETLDKPGRAIRGLLGGDVGALANLIPFSDTMGLTDPEDSTSGRDLLEKAGFLNANTPGLDTGDVVGFGAEVLLDPLTYLGIGPLTKAGKALAKTGKVSKTLPSRIKAGEQALAELRIPFTDVGVKLGTSDAAADAAGKVTGLVSDAFLESPAGRGLNAMFNPAVQNFRHSRKAMEAASDSYDDLLRNPAAAELNIRNIGREYEDLAEAADRSLVRDYAELPRAFDDDGNEFINPEVLNTWMQRPDVAGNPNLPRIVKFSDELRTAKNKYFGDAQDMGLDLSEMIDDAIDHMPRTHQRGEADNIVRGVAEAFRGKKDKIFRGRKNWLTGIQGGTKSANEFVSQLAGWRGRGMDKDDVLDSLTRDLYGWYGVEKEGQSVYKSASPAIQSKARQFADWVDKLPHEKYKDAPFFNNDVVSDVIIQARGLSRAKTQAEMITGLVKETMADFSDELKAQGFGKLDKSDDGLVPLSKVMEDMGFDVTQDSKLWNVLGKNGENARGLFIPEEVSKDLGRFVTSWQKPDTLHPFLDFYDKMLDGFRAGVTQMWPAFHGRNAMGGTYYDTISGAHRPLSEGGIFADTMEMDKFLRGGGIEIDQRLADAGVESPEHLYDVLTSYGLVDSGTQAVDTTRAAAATKLAEEAIGGGRFKHTTYTRKAPQGVLKSAKDVLGDAVGNIPAAEGSNIATKALDKSASVARRAVEQGQKVGNHVEEVMRSRHFLARVRQGMTFDQAAASVRKWHFDYTATGLTDFERKVMKRVVPFWCVPDDSEILTRDGWKSCYELQVGEEVLTYNSESDESEWQPCEEVAMFDHDEELHVLANSRHELRFTKGHRWAVRTKAINTKRDYGKGTYTYPEKREVIPFEDCNTKHDIIVAAPLKEGGPSLLTVEEARLLGWAVTDGHHRWRGNHCEVVLSQSPKKFIEEVAEVAGGSRSKPHPETGTVYFYVPREKVRTIEKYLDHDNLITVVTRLNREAAEAMYDAMYKADGNTSPDHPNDFFACRSDPGVRLAFRALATILGKRANNNPRGIYVSHRRHMQLKGLHHEMREHKGKVWCPRTKNGTWVMRQGDTITITGNTFARNNTPLVLGELVHNPGGAIAQSIRASNVARSDAEFVPGYIGEGVAAQIGPDRFLSGTGLPFEEPFERLVAPRGTDVLDAGARTLQKLFASSSPAIKVPIEIGMQKSTFTGKDFSDTYPYPTDNPNLNALLGGTPAARAITTARKLGDDRKEPGIKALDLFSGVKITDVKDGLDAARQRELLDQFTERAKNDPNWASFELPYVPKENLPNLSEEEQDLLQYFKEENERARKARQARELLTQ